LQFLGLGCKGLFKKVLLHTQPNCGRLAEEVAANLFADKGFAVFKPGE